MASPEKTLGVSGGMGHVDLKGLFNRELDRALELVAVLEDGTEAHCGHRHKRSRKYMQYRPTDRQCYRMNDGRRIERFFYRGVA